jgi:hypothetical protein
MGRHGRWSGGLVVAAIAVAALLGGLAATTRAGRGVDAGAAVVPRAVALPAGPHPYPPPVGARERANRRAAARDAAGLLARVVLPPGATRSSQEPSGDDGQLARAADRPAETKLLDRHSWWRVAGGVPAVSAFITSHVPVGARLVGGSTSGGPGQPSGSSEDFGWPPVGRTLGTRMLVVSLAALSGDETGLRVDAEVQWIVPRPAGEQIPDQVRVMDVTVGRLGAPPSTSIMVTAPRQVNRIVTMIDRLQIVQPGVTSCPEEPADPAQVTFTFRARPGGPVLASAAEAANAAGPASPCDAMPLTIDGRSQIPLLGGAAVVEEAQRLLGVKLTRR